MSNSSNTNQTPGGELSRRQTLKLLGGAAAFTFLQRKSAAAPIPVSRFVDSVSLERIADRDSSLKPPLLIDMQTHVWWREGGINKMSERGEAFLKTLAGARSGILGRPVPISDMGRVMFMEDVFLESETDIAFLNSFGMRGAFDGIDLFPPREAAKIRSMAPARVRVLGCEDPPDGHSAVVVAEQLKRLDFRDPQTMKLQNSMDVPGCAGINHADFSIDGRFAIFTCEFQGRLAKIDFVEHKVIGYLTLSKGGMPQDIRVSPDGKIFFVADMKANGVFLIDGDKFSEIGFIKTGLGTHGLYPSRDASKLYVANRGINKVFGPPRGKGSVSVIDFTTHKTLASWPIPGGGSPDMGNVSADGKQLWLSGRFDDVVYDIDTTTGEMKSIPVGKEPHGLTVWPQPGRYSLGHTGNLR